MFIINVGVLVEHQMYKNIIIYITTCIFMYLLFKFGTTLCVLLIFNQILCQLYDILNIYLS